MNEEIKEILDRMSELVKHKYDKEIHTYNLFDDIQELLNYITNLQEENQKLVKVIDTILGFNFFKEECPLNFGFEDEKENKSLDVFYEDEWCETNCNDEYKKCWLEYFNKLTELKGGSDE